MQVISDDGLNPIFSGHCPALIKPSLSAASSWRFGYRQEFKFCSVRCGETPLPLRDDSSGRMQSYLAK
jgi:hypothetical protein